MPVFRLLLVVLLVLNLLALAAGQGWLGSSQSRGEPERLTNQINPEAIVLIPQDTSAAQSPPVDPPGATPATLRGAGTETASTPLPDQAPSTPVRRSPESVEALPQAAQRAPEPAPPTLGRSGSAPMCIAFVNLEEARAHAIAQVARLTVPGLDSVRQLDETPSNWWVRIAPSASRTAAEEKVRELRGLGVSDLFIVREEGPHQFAISLGLYKSEGRAAQHLADLRARRVRGAEVVPRAPFTYRVEIRGDRDDRDGLIATLSAQFSGEIPEACTP